MTRIYFTWWLACIILSFSVCAQDNVTWHKRVIREIDMRVPQPTKFGNQKIAAHDTNLVELLVPPMKAGKLAAYSNFDCDFSRKLTLYEINDSGIVCHGEDSEAFVDPATNIEKKIYIDRSPHLERIHKYHVLEEWSFDSASGRTNIQIAGIAPAKEIYGDDGVFRGVQTMFWVKYADAIKVLAHYDRLHPTKSFATYIWDDYFLSDVKPQVAK